MTLFDFIVNFERNKIKDGFVKTSKKINLDYFYQIKYEIEYIGKLSKEYIEFPINNMLFEIKSEIPLLACVCYIE